jgi:hypothetical protein
MKRQQYNDEELYQEFMAELDKGAAEYDHMMASGEVPAKRNKATTMKWYAVAAAVAGLLIISTTLFVRNQDDVGRHTASTESAKKEKLLTGKKTIVPRTENTDDLYRLTARIERKPEKKQQTASNNIFTAMLPDVVFCSDSNDDPNNDIRLPQVRKERSFDLVCNVVLPDITAYADSTLFTSNTELMVACDEICYNDTNF